MAGTAAISSTIAVTAAPSESFREFQKVSAGALFLALPGARDGFFVLAYERESILVLGALPQNGMHAATWAFVRQIPLQSRHGVG